MESPGKAVHKRSFKEIYSTKMNHKQPKLDLEKILRIGNEGTQKWKVAHKRLTRDVKAVNLFVEQLLSGSILFFDEIPCDAASWTTRSDFCTSQNVRAHFKHQEPLCYELRLQGS